MNFIEAYSDCQKACMVPSIIADIEENMLSSHLDVGAGHSPET